MALLVSEVRIALIERLKDITDVSNTIFIHWCDFANKQIYRHLIGIDPQRFISTQNYTVSSMPQTSALPVDFYTIDSHELGFYEIDNDGLDTENRLVRTGHGRRDAGYYLQGANVIFTGIEDGTIYRLRYLPNITTINELTDYFTLTTASGGVEIIPDEFLQFLIEDLIILYNQWDENAGDESLADFRFVRLLDEFSRNVRREPAAYSLPDFTSNF